MKKALSLILAAALCLSLTACAGESETTQPRDTALAENRMWVTKTSEVYPLAPGSTITGIARLGGNLLIAGHDRDSRPVLGLASCTAGSGEAVSIGDAKTIPLDEPEAVDETAIYGITAGGDGFFYVLTGESPATWINDRGERVKNDQYEGRYSILKYSETGEFSDRMKLTGWQGGHAAGIAVGDHGEISLYGSMYISLLTWDGGVIRTESVDDGSFVLSVSLCGSGLIASVHEVSKARGTYYLIDGKSGLLSELEARGEYEEFTVDLGNWSVTQGLGGEYIVNDGNSFYVLDFDGGTCQKLFQWNQAQNNSECTYACRLSENTFVYTGDGRECLFVASRVVQEYKDRSVVKVALFGTRSDTQLAAINAADGDYIYEYTLYEAGQLDQLRAELSGKNAPDLVLFNCYSGLDTNSEYFDDLYSYIAADPELSRDSFLPNLLKALSVKGRLTQLWEYVQINTMAARTADVGDGKGLTPADYNRILKEKEEYSAMFLGLYGDDQEALLSSVATLALSVYTDKDNATCSFDSESFTELLRWVKDAGSEFAEYVSGVPYQENIQKVVAFPDLLVLSRAHFTPAELFGEPVTFAGYPLGEQCGHYYSNSGNTAMAIPALGSNKEGAWAYIRNQLSFETQYNAQAERNSPAVPVNYEAMKRLAANILTKEEVAQVIGLVSDTRFAATYVDEPLHEIIMTSGLAYLAGDKTLEEAVDLIQSRVSVYMVERYG